MAACPELLPSYRRLAPHLQDRVRRVISTGFNLMQFAQGESLPASLLSLRRLARDRDGPRLCRFALLLWILRVPAFWRVPGLLKNMRGAIEALLRLEDGTVGAARVYDEFLSTRASLLNFAFDAQDRSERHLVRLALMLRLTTPSEAVVLKGAFGLLDLDVQAVLTGELNATGVDDGWGILVYYAPDLLRNVRALAGSNQREGLVAGLSLLARVYVAARQTLDRHPGVGVYTCKVQSLALLAKGTTLAAFEAESSFVLEHFGDEGEVWVTSTAPPEEPRSPSPRPRSPTHLL